MVDTILNLLFLILPVLHSGLSFILVLKSNKFKNLNFPLDFGLRFNGKRIFGKNKTIKGPLFMSVFTMIYGFMTYQFFKNILNLQLSSSQVLLYFLLVGLFYSLGELPNSFIKRQLAIKPGENYQGGILRYLFKLADTFDSLIVIGIIYLILFNIPLKTVIVAILVGGFIHQMTDYLMIKLQLK